MTPERWQRIDKLFDEALLVEPLQRAAFLDEACADDPDLRGEIESLLDASRQAGDFIESPLLSAGENSGSYFASLAGQSLGPYRLLREIGRGGMGVVYLAARDDDQFQKQVAIKVVQAGPHSKELLRRFRRERQILANLDHPNIARLLDGGTTQHGVAYLVMEYVAGTPITQYCDECKLSITDRLKLFRIVCAAVQYAHQSLVIHRDIKPGNILVTAKGEVKLLDFGIAKLLDADSDHRDSKTTSGLHVMTPEYASPEQIQSETVTTASDVYSLGIVLYELLTGHYPYRFKDRSLQEIMRVICEQEPEPPSRAIARIETRAGDGTTQSTISPETVSRTREGKPDKLRARLRGDLNDIALMALRKDPRQRYRTVEQLSEDIRRHLEGRPVFARKATLAYRASKFIRRYKTGAAVAAIVLLTLLGGILATMRQASIARQEARDKRRLLYAAQMNMAEQAWETTNIGRLRELVEGQMPSDGEEDLRGFEWRYLWRLYHNNGERFTLEHHIEVWTVAFSPDGKLLAAGDEAGLVTLWNTATGQDFAVLRGHDDFIGDVAFSPDGKMLATASGDRTVKLWDTATWQVFATLKGHTQKVRVLSFSSDGKKLASGADDGTAKLWDVASGRELITIQVGEAMVRSLALSPDGKKLATPGNVSVAVWNTITGKKFPGFHSKMNGYWSLRFSPDGRQLAATSDRSVALLDATTGEEMAVFEGHGSLVRSVAFSPDGKMLASGSLDRTIKVWDIASGAALKTIKGHVGGVFSVAFSPDGRTLASSSSDLSARLWDIATALEFSYLESKHLRAVFSPDGGKPAVALYQGCLIVTLLDAGSGQQFATFDTHSSQVSSAAFSPDGKKLATGDVLGVVKLWEVDSQKQIASIHAHSGLVASMMFSPDGQKLATASRDHTAKLWDAVSGQEIFALTRHDHHLSAISFSPDGKLLATGSYDKTAKLWNAKTGRQLATLRGHLKPVLCLAFSPDGETLATGSSDSTVKLWDPATGQEKATFTGHAGHVNSMAFSPDGKRLATGGDEGVVRLWDAATGQEVIALSGHTDSVGSVVFSPDGDTLMSAGFDLTVRFWRAASREEALPHRRK